MKALRTSSQRSNIRLRSAILCLVWVVALLAGCQGAPQQAQVTSVSPVSQAVTQPSPMAEITFVAHLPDKLAKGQSLYLELLDEVTGLALNSVRAKMETKDQQSWAVKIPFALGSVLKYRYVRDNDPIGVEYNSLNQQVRYRMFIVDGPGLVHDTVAAWKSAPVSSGGLGRIRGQVANKVNNSPVVNALVEAGGVQTLTASDGSFLLEGLPPGTHNVVVYSLEGAFKPFQQGAVVANESTTPALIYLTQSQQVNVTFHVKPPKDNFKGVPIRLVGNLVELGNTFADLRGGMNVLASRAPQMTSLPDGRYSITMKLPAGLDLRYKYSLGDGFWNAEHTADGQMRVRQVIIPNKDVTYDDTIDTWGTQKFAPVSFTVNVPADTPATNTISIQFNPFGWTEPIPMWPVGNNRWFYILYSPLDAFSSASYRYCRNDQCGTADATDTRGPAAKGKSFSPDGKNQDFNDTVKAWAWFDPLTGPVTVPGTKITSHGASFKAGAELMTGYRPAWQPYLVWAFQTLKDTGANSVMLTPTWHVTRQNPPVIEPITGQDPMWLDLTQMSNQAQQKGLEVGLHPVLQYNQDPATWWQKATRDDGWWQTWFDRYHNFILYHADLAAQAGAKSLVIGDASLTPALPAGTLADGKPSGVPGDADKRWSQIIADVRARYTGKLIWLVAYNGKLAPVPDFTKNLDILYVQMSAPFVKTEQTSLEKSFATALDTDILKVQEKTNQPVILGLRYPSAANALGDCVKSGDSCLTPEAFNQPALDGPGLELSPQDQVDVYAAALAAVNQRSWIAGFYSLGYNPVVELRDTSNSVRGKPASNLLWYWFPRLTGLQK